MAEPFIYNQYSCEEALREAGFDLEQVKEYLCQDEIETLKADAYAATEDRDHYEWIADAISCDLNNAIELLYQIKTDLEAGRGTKKGLAENIRTFLEERQLKKKI